MDLRKKGASALSASTQRKYQVFANHVIWYDRETHEFKNRLHVANIRKIEKSQDNRKIDFILKHKLRNLGNRAVLKVYTCRESFCSPDNSTQDFVNKVNEERKKLNPNILTDQSPVKQDHFVGFKNCGATCYMNSVLQSLIHTRALAELYLNKSLSIKEDAENSGQMTKAMQSLYKKYYKETANKGNFKPINFTKALKAHSKFRSFSPRKMQDPDEFLGRFFEILSSEIQEDFNKLFNFSTATTTECKKDGKSVYSSDRVSYFNRLSLPFSKAAVDPASVKSKEFKLIDMISSYKARDDLDAGFACGANSEDQPIKKDEAFRSVDFKRLPGLEGPGYLIIQVKRMAFNMKTGRSSKIHSPLNFPLQIALPSKDSKKDSVYRLYAFINHNGLTLGSGHYISVVRDFDPDGPWYQIDDHVISKKTTNQVLNHYKRRVYLLFYEKI